jgi:hypothetical protein
VIAAALLAAILPLDAPGMTMMTAGEMIGLLAILTGIVDGLAMMIETEKTETLIETDPADTAMMDIAAARLIHPDTIVTVTAILIGVAGTTDFIPSEPTPCILRISYIAYAAN